MEWLAGLPWCAPGLCTIQGWFSAIAGIAAILTLFVLWLTLRQMRRSAFAELRAYVMIEAAEITVVGNIRKVHIATRNLGKTIAYNVEIDTHQFYAASDNPNIPPYVGPGKARLVDLGPGQECHSIYDCGLGLQDAIANIPMDQLRFFATGSITYRDAFRMERKTTFGYAARVDAGGPIVAPMTFYGTSSCAT